MRDAFKSPGFFFLPNKSTFGAVTTGLLTTAASAAAFSAAALSAAAFSATAFSADAAFSASALALASAASFSAWGGELIKLGGLGRPEDLERPREALRSLPLPGEGVSLACGGSVGSEGLPA